MLIGTRRIAFWSFGLVIVFAVYVYGERSTTTNKRRNVFRSFSRFGPGVPMAQGPVHVGRIQSGPSGARMPTAVIFKRPSLRENAYAPLYGLGGRRRDWED